MAGSDQTDVVVVGAGMGGAAVSYVLTDGGARVVLLDQGPRVEPADRPLESREWELSLTGEWSFDPNVRQLRADYPVRADGFQPYLYNGVGGSTNHFGAFWHRLKPVDFRKGSEHGLGGARDWPITYEDLAPYYDLNDRYVGVSGVSGDPSYPPRSAPRLPPLRHGRHAHSYARAFEQLGWHWWPGDAGIISTSYEGRLACNLCGHCNAGCTRGAIGTADLVYVDPAVRRGLDLRPNSRVVRVTTNRGAVTGVEYIDLETDAVHRVEASVVVVAANGIGTPRLLLNSASSEYPNGLGNDHGLVGTHLMLHGWLIADTWLDSPTEHYKGPATATLYSHEFYDTDSDRGFVNGFGITVSAAFGPGLIALGGVTGQSPLPWGRDHHVEFERRFNRHCYVNVQVDDLPVPTNRVTIDPERKDSSGLPAARAEYHLHQNDRRVLNFAKERVAELTQAVGAWEVNYQPIDEDYNPPGWHLMGTCRMGGSPETSVTDAWHRVWGVTGLVVCDSSSMVTGGAANPAATVGALGLRCGRGLLEGKARRVEASTN